MPTLAALAANDDPFMGAVRRMIREEVEHVMLEEIRTAQARVEQQIKAKVDAIALRVLSAYSIERMGHRLVIEVDQRKLDGAVP